MPPNFNVGGFRDQSSQKLREECERKSPNSEGLKGDLDDF